jgi:thiosulfate reductase cytochrome b subunit
VDEYNPWPKIAYISAFLMLTPTVLLSGTIIAIKSCIPSDTGAVRRSAIDSKDSFFDRLR